MTTITKQCEVGGSLIFESDEYTDAKIKIASFVFTERQADPYFSDSTTYVEIDKETAMKLIAAMKEHFEI